ncbi:MAG: undecaprenyl-phosphate glucose phosphotransferase [Azonexus sp.]|nr:undecaprenyl-phosphate glucose phosphotransferase [Azonexus sp.]
MTSTISELSSGKRLRRGAQLVIGRENLLNLAEALLEPVVLTVATMLVAYYFEYEFSPPYLLLGIILFSLSFPGPARLHLPLWHGLASMLSSWSVIAALALAFGYATHWLGAFRVEAIYAWLWFSPVLLVIAQIVFRWSAPIVLNMQGVPRTFVVVGMNEQGVSFARQVIASPYSADRILGFFDDRSENRLTGLKDFSLLGRLDALGEFVRANQVHAIYLSLPMATQPRILKLLDDLRDTTSSIYFIPDMFVSDLIQSRVVSNGGQPVIAVCETPFTGTNGLVKRLSDIAIAFVLLVLLAPLMVLIALAVKITSPGPIVFKQRRYGLDGAEISVYKFRSMRVCEDGAAITQAQKNDPRITPLGAFLRRSSLDELPQFINVLQGRMSLVGPRPHAVAHNELYRKLIKGYMIRHKVKPGITGWAQINGCRGETDSLDKMQARIDLDLEYLRNWSLGLDVQIILRTAGVVVRGNNAY